MLHCIVCKTPLSGGLDTYGQAGVERCYDCKEIDIADHALAYYKFFGDWHEDADDLKQLAQEKSKAGAATPAGTTINPLLRGKHDR